MTLEMARLLVAVVALLTAETVARECFNKPGEDVSKAVCIPGHWNFLRASSVAIKSTSTCGNTPSTLCRLKPDNGCFKCDRSDSKTKHPPSYMVDRSYETFWASESWWNWFQTEKTRPLQANITIHLNKSFDATAELTMTFDSVRPFAMIIEKSSDFGITWRTLYYYADDCQKRFSMKNTDPKEIARGDFGAFCSQLYSKLQPKSGGQVIFSFKKRYEEEAEFFKPDVQNYIKVTDFRFQLLYPGTDGLEIQQTENSLSSYFYAISDISMVGRCRCNGHAAVCGYNNTAYGVNQCLNCLHFTTGIDCDQCLPLYNNRTWIPATSKTEPNPCQRCECHDHADSCKYESKLGYGVCQDCYHNTTGHFCQDCKDTFYRNISLPLNHPRICLACECFPEGILNNGTCNVNDGQCLCRQNVTGRRCDHCVDTYWGYKVDPIGHCTACNCLVTGTKNGSLNCDQMTGQCDCKANIDQKSCTQCKHGFFKFPQTIGEDCLKCDCDYGGSDTGICNKVTGKCECRKNIEGIRCTIVSPGFFTGNLDFYRLEAELSGGTFEYTSNTVDWNRYFTGTGYGTISPPQFVVFTKKINNTFSGQVVIRYSTESSQLVNTALELSISALGTSSCVGVSKTIAVTGLRKGQGETWISAPKDAITFCGDQEFSFNLTYKNLAASNASIQIDSLVLMPVLGDLRVYKVAKQQGHAHGLDMETMEGCWNNWKTLAGINQSQPLCRNFTFSGMAEVLNGALPCGCSIVGSVPNTTCNQDGGQCHCKPGVTGRTCDRCLPGFYNLTSSGCSACKCNAIGSRHLVCNAVTGQCPCKPGVVTRTCERCQDSYYGFSTGKGCVNCRCNASGSVTLQCDGVTGNCPCKNSTDGPKCDKCRFGFYNYTTDGCQSCHCDKDGSSTLQCHLQTGKCDCKSNVQGFKCDKCKDGFFNRDVINPSGCTPCYCYGRSTNCSSAKGYVKSFIESNPVDKKWQPNINFIKMTANQNRKIVNAEYKAGQYGTLLLPGLNGTLYRSYGQLLTFKIKFLSPNGLGVQMSIIIEPSNGLVRAELRVAPKPSLNVTLYHVLLHESNSVRPLRADQLQASLAHVINMKLKLNFTSNGTMELDTAKMASAKEGNVGEEAGNVENCTCREENYAGLSCELCSRGYTRQPSNKQKPVSTPPLYSTRCELCSCTNRSTECDGETGRCKNCRTGSMGYFCDECQPGVDNTTDCNQCFPGYYGLYLNKFNGCGACDCILKNTLYGNQSVCALDDGQCVCKANISGRICDRCHENAYNNSQGHCIDCPVCYRLLQVFVHELRDNITTVEGALYNLRNGGSGDATFEKRLLQAEENVRLLLRIAANSTDVEKDLHRELQSLNETLDEMEAQLTGPVTSGVTSLEGVVTGMSRDRNRTEELIKLTEKMVNEAYHLLNTSVRVLVNQAGLSEQYLKDLSPKFKALEKQAVIQADTQKRTAADIVSKSNATSLMVKEANSSSLQTVHDHEINKDKIHKLRATSLAAKNLGVQVNKTASTLVKNSSLVLKNAKLALQSVSKLNPSNQDELKSILETITFVNSNATASITAIEKYNVEFQTVRETVQRSVEETELYLSQVSSISYNVGWVLDEAKRAEAEAKAAVASAAKTYKDAKDMLQILKTFETKANESQRLAATSLEKSKEANTTSQRAIAYSQSINDSIQATLAIADRGLVIATLARDMAYNESQDVSSVHSQAITLKRETDSTKYTTENYQAIQRNVTDITTQIKPAESACKVNYTRYALDAQEKSTEALKNANKASNDINKAKQAVDQITQEFGELQYVNVTRLRELQNEVKRLREAFEKKDVSTLNKSLLSAKEKQKIFIDNYKKQVQELRKQVNEMRTLRDSLKSVPHRGCT